MDTFEADQLVTAPAEVPTPEQVAETSLQDQLYPNEVKTEDVDADTLPAGEGEDTGEGGEEEASRPVDAPHSWSAEDKAIFAALPPEAQAIINRRETERDTFVRQKGEEVVQVRRQVETEARGIVQQVHQNSVQQYEALATQMQAFLPQPPDQNLIWSGNVQDHALYNQQKALYDMGVAQYQQVQRQYDTAKQQATVLEQQAMQEEIQRGNTVLAETFGTDWTDPSKQKLLIEKLEPIGRELGYADRMGAADATDIIALSKIAELKVKADKYDALNKAKMTDVRAQRGIPKVTQPGSGTSAVSSNQSADVTRTLYPNDPPRR